MSAALRLLQCHDPFQEVPDVTAAFTTALEMDGLVVSLLTDGEDLELLWCSEGPTRHFEDLQFTLGQGPGPDTVRTGAVQWVPDWAHVHPGRWPALTSQATALQAQAVFCFPLAIGTVRIGVLTTVRRAPGPLDRHQADNAWMLAAALTARYLNTGQARLEHLAPGGTPPRRRFYQASGMVGAQLGIPASQAVLRLRAFAYSSGRPLTDICQDVLDRRSAWTTATTDRRQQPPGRTPRAHAPRPGPAIRGGSPAGRSPLARIEPDQDRVLFCGVGTIAAALIETASKTRLSSVPGIVGHQMRGLRTFTYPTTGQRRPGDALRRPERTPGHRRPAGFLQHTPLPIAGRLLRHSGAHRDEAGTVVAKKLR
ncbi:hypothetical protein [Streptacidiphilus sp. PAMC 29251]